MNIIATTGMVLLLVLAGCVPGTGQASEINSFEECVAAGNPVMESYPEQCRANGKTFVRDVSSETPANVPVPPAVEAARSYAMEQTGAEKDDTIILEAHEREWTDSCLGLGGPAESCLQAITPGYEVVVVANGIEFTLRTNEDGSAVREEIRKTDDGSMKLIANIPDTPAIVAARAYLVEKYNVDEEKFLTIDVQEKDWTDGCLGLGGPEESCLQAITPGYQITLTDMDYDYVVRTDLDGNSVREESRTEVENGILR